jgi:hypothetical protein
MTQSPLLQSVYLCVPVHLLNSSADYWLSYCAPNIPKCMQRLSFGGMMPGYGVSIVIGAAQRTPFTDEETTAKIVPIVNYIFTKWSLLHNDQLDCNPWICRFLYITKVHAGFYTRCAVCAVSESRSIKTHTWLHFTGSRKFRRLRLLLSMSNKHFTGARCTLHGSEWRSWSQDSVLHTWVIYIYIYIFIIWRL